MNMPLPADLTQIIIAWVRRNRQARIPAGTEVLPATNLLEAGILDSLAFVELLAYLETEHGCTIQLLDADPEEFSTPGGVAALALKGAAANATGN